MPGLRKRALPTPPRVVTLRGIPVAIDEDLSRVYGVTTARLNQALRRNAARFPEDFAFQVNATEFRHLKSQFVISSGGHGGRRNRPWVFTEHGAVMAATVLRSERAVEMSVFVVRAFVRLRDIATTHRELANKLAAVERRVANHDEDLKAMLAALRKLIAPPPGTRRRIGFSA